MNNKLYAVFNQSYDGYLPELYQEVTLGEWDNLSEITREILMPNEKHGLLFVKKIQL